jgi:predicted SprT family Zn-dependent metalloprotease
LLRSWNRVLKNEIRTLFFNHRIRVPEPRVQVDFRMKRWGEWDPLSRTVRLSARLLLEHSWDSVVETLKHELAHAIADSRSGHAEPPHGPAFREACFRLGASPRASASEADMMAAKIETGPGGDRARELKEKVRKLLALSASLNEHEALSAMQKANRLMLRHNLSLESAHPLEHYTYRRIGRASLRRSSEEIQILNILADFFFVEYILVPVYDPVNDREPSEIEILGRPENLDMAEYVHTFLTRECEYLWKRYRKEHGVGGKRLKKSYVLGLLEGFRESLASTRSSAGSRALVAYRDPGLGEYFAYRHPRVRRTRGRGTGIHPGTYRRGETDGGRIRIRKPFGPSPGPALLPGPLRRK